MSSRSQSYIWDINIFISSSLLFHWYFHLSKKPKLYTSQAATSQAATSQAATSLSSTHTIQHLISQCPSLHHIFYPSIFLFNPHIQLIAFVLYNEYNNLFPPYKWMMESITMDDGEAMYLDWVNTIPNFSHSDTTPILLIHHGAFSHSRDLPGQCYIGEALRRGWIVCALNRRGHYGKLTKPKFNLFGCTNDTRSIVENNIKARRPNSRVFMIGISAGSAVVARYMGEQGLHRKSEATPILGFCDAAVGVSPAYNIEVCMSRLKMPYSAKLLSSAKRFHLEGNKEILEPCVSYSKCANTSDLQSWIEHSWSMAGFSSQEEYFEYSNPMRVCSHILEPCLFINAEDDPVSVVENVYENLHIFETGACGAALALTKTGSHCSFLGLGMTSWVERVAFEFFDAFLSEKREKEST